MFQKSIGLYLLKSNCNIWLSLKKKNASQKFMVFRRSDVFSATEHFVLGKYKILAWHWQHCAALLVLYAVQKAEIYHGLERRVL
jgi:hypothetical protein